MEDIILIIITGLLNLFSFVIGAKIGQKVVNNEKIKLPEFNPIKVIEKHKEQKEVKKEQKRINTILENINNYDGTSNKQKKVN